jgi:hypothetical protein
MNRPTKQEELMRFSRALISTCLVVTPLLAASVTQAQDNCGPPQPITAFQMTRAIEYDVDIVPLEIGGTSANFLLGTGSYLTMIRQSAAENLKMSLRPSADVRTLHTTGSGSQSDAVIPQFKLGLINGSDTVFHIAPETDASNSGFVLQVIGKSGAAFPFMANRGTAIGIGGMTGVFISNLWTSAAMMGMDFTVSSTNYQTAANTRAFDGVFGLDYITGYDSDIDFGTDTYQMFSTDHCPGPGPGVFATTPDVAVVPILKGELSLHIPVKMDGQTFNALIDTSSTVSTLREDVAKLVYGISPSAPPATASARDLPAAGSAGTSETVIVHGDPVVEHTFQTRSFGGVTVTNPHMVLVPLSSGYLLSDTQRTTGSLLTSQKVLNVPQLTIGMDILRKLHIYVAPKEGNIYITEASVPNQAQSASIKDIYRQYVPKRIADLNRYIAAHPRDFLALNERCYARAATKTELDAALADCDQAIKLKPGDPSTLESRALVLYQQGKYQDALSAYDAVLAINPRQASALLLRGYTKAKLGDQAGMASDIAAAKAANSAVEAQLLALDISG